MTDPRKGEQEQAREPSLADFHRAANDGMVRMASLLPVGEYRLTLIARHAEPSKNIVLSNDNLALATAALAARESWTVNVRGPDEPTMADVSNG